MPTHQRSPFRRPRSPLMSYISSMHWGPHPSNGTACKPSRRGGAPEYMSCPAYGVQRQNYWLMPRFELSTQDRTHRSSSHMGCHGTITRLQRRALSHANEIYMSNARVLCQGREVAGEDRGYGSTLPQRAVAQASAVQGHARPINQAPLHQPTRHTTPPANILRAGQEPPYTHQHTPRPNNQQAALP